MACQGCVFLVCCLCSPHVVFCVFTVGIFTVGVFTVDKFTVGMLTVGLVLFVLHPPPPFCPPPPPPWFWPRQASLPECAICSRIISASIFIDLNIDMFVIVDVFRYLFLSRAQPAKPSKQLVFNIHLMFVPFRKTYF